MADQAERPPTASAVSSQESTDLFTSNENTNKSSNKRALLSQLSDSIHSGASGGSDGVEIEVVTAKTATDLALIEDTDVDVEVEEKVALSEPNSPSSAQKPPNKNAITSSGSSSYGYDAIGHGYTILDDSISQGKVDIDATLPTPYTTGKACSLFYKLYYLIESLIVVNPRLYSLWLLYRSVFPRALVLVDMVTDVLVAYQLFVKDQTALFALSCLFIVFPFYMVWNTSLRYLLDIYLYFFYLVVFFYDFIYFLILVDIY